MKEFKEKDKSSFTYWFKHWKAFNKCAIDHHCWRIQFLFHDIEKPFLMIYFNKDYKKVKEWHRTHNRHHLEYDGDNNYDYIAMAIDWECSGSTKPWCKLNAREELDFLINKEGGQRLFNIKYPYVSKRLNEIFDKYSF